MPESKLFATLRMLEESKTEFIVVGGLSAVLNGAPVQTYDVDIVYARSEENIERLLGVLRALDAVFRIQPERRLRPTLSHLSGSGHLNLLTRNGPLDLLSSIGQGLTYETLLLRSIEMEIGGGIRIRVHRYSTVVTD